MCCVTGSEARSAAARPEGSAAAVVAMDVLLLSPLLSAVADLQAAAMARGVPTVTATGVIAIVVCAVGGAVGGVQGQIQAAGAAGRPRAAAHAAQQQLPLDLKAAGCVTNYTTKDMAISMPPTSSNSASLSAESECDGKCSSEYSCRLGQHGEAAHLL